MVSCSESEISQKSWILLCFKNVRNQKAYFHSHKMWASSRCCPCSLKSICPDYFLHVTALQRWEPDWMKSQEWNWSGMENTGNQTYSKLCLKIARGTRAQMSKHHNKWVMFKDWLKVDTDSPSLCLAPLHYCCCICINSDCFVDFCSLPRRCSTPLSVTDWGIHLYLYVCVSVVMCVHVRPSESSSTHVQTGGGL